MATGLTAGVIYEFKVEARNQYDHSAYSEVLTLLCAFIPEIPTDVLTSIDSPYSSTMKVEWTLPTDNGSPITSYRVFILEIGTTTYTEESVDCVGTDATVISTSSCLINISTLLASPYNVDGADYIYAKVLAANVYGESDQSVEGNGAYYTRVPDAPVNVQEDISVRTYTDDGLTWQDGVNNGGVPIIDYRVN